MFGLRWKCSSASSKSLTVWKSSLLKLMKIGMGWSLYFWVQKFLRYRMIRNRVISTLLPKHAINLGLHRALSEQKLIFVIHLRRQQIGEGQDSQVLGGEAWPWSYFESPHIKTLCVTKPPKDYNHPKEPGGHQLWPSVPDLLAALFRTTR